MQGSKLLLNGGLLLPLVLAAELDPLVTRWTFGAHEPYPMYRRIGRKSTGGIEGSAKWVKDWLNWWDENAPARMEEAGVNALHSRFYKGMGWAEERKDLPNVRKFADNCHRHGVTALAYVQFATLYYEVMKGEIPDIEDWASVDADGRKHIYNTQYNRWVPCVQNEKWVEYMKRILTLALTEGGFDGIMFDNTFSYACYCPRCERKFAEYVNSRPDCLERFGLEKLPGVRIPRPYRHETAPKDVMDPLQQEWLLWRVRRMSEIMATFYRHVKSVKPNAIVSANSGSFFGENGYGHKSVDIIDMAKSLDLFMMQTANFPGYVAEKGIPGEHYIVNRQRDLRMARDLGKSIVALCDGDAGMDDLDETHYLRPFYEDLVWGGIPTDRTIMSPVRRPGFIDEERFAARRRTLKEFREFAEGNRKYFTAKPYVPVRVFYSSSGCNLSPAMSHAVSTVEEILLRNHVPYGYVVSVDGERPAIPAGTELLVLPNARWMSEAQIAAVRDFAAKGGKLVITGGETGLRDERGCQRFENPLEPLRKCANVAWRDEVDEAQRNRLGWVTRVLPPKDHGRALMADIAKTGYRLKYSFENLPEFVFVEIKRHGEQDVVHFVNFNPAERVNGVKIKVKGEGGGEVQVEGGGGEVVKVDPFTQYRMVLIGRR